MFRCDARNVILGLSSDDSQIYQVKVNCESSPLEFVKFCSSSDYKLYVSGDSSRFKYYSAGL